RSTKTNGPTSATAGSKACRRLVVGISLATCGGIWPPRLPASRRTYPASSIPGTSTRSWGDTAKLSTMYFPPVRAELAEHKEVFNRRLCAISLALLLLALLLGGGFGGLLGSGLLRRRLLRRRLLRRRLFLRRRLLRALGGGLHRLGLR